MSLTSSPFPDATQIGRYGTLSLLKQNDPENANTVAVAFGIDTEVLTFGRDRDSGIRLCYPDVDQLHCKITFEEKKAFLVVLGATGLTVDGCKIYPNLSSSSPTTVPLTNNTEFEIHGKRFKFTYPPKELRAQLYASPAKPRSRALRMSMINSAQVFSPRPSPNPLENLRVLKSPLKPFRNAAPSPSPIRKSIFPQLDLEDEEVVLVEGNCPRVVEEDKDLVILEHVEVPSARSRPPSPTKTSTTNGHTQALPSTQLLQLQAQQLPRPPKTPTRSRPSLHKAVLMRSAQKVVLSADVVEEEMEEEMEVLGALAEDEGDEREKRKLQDVGEEDEADEEEQEEGGSSWRKSIGNMWPFRLSASPTKPKENEDATMDADASNTLVTNAATPIHEDDEEINDEADENPAPLGNSLYPPIPRFQIPAAPSTPRHNLPSSSSTGRMFMTPQPSQLGNRFSLAPRVSLGGDGPQRIKIEDQVWKVQDLMAQPEPSTSTSNDTTAGVGRGRPSIRGWSQPPQAQTPRQKLSEEERNAIRERRRSALKNPDMFFGGIPGMGIASPVKASMSPSKSNGFGTESSVERKEDDDLDTRSLLARMRETVENMKDAKERRASLALASPKKDVASFEAVISASIPDSEARDAQVEADTQPAFSLLRTPSTKEKSSAPRRSLFILEKPQSQSSATLDAAPETTIDMSDFVSIPLPPPPPTPLLSPLKTRTGRKLGAPTPASSRTKVAVDTPLLADDEASPGEHCEEREDDENEVGKGKKAMIMRGSGRADEKESDAEDEDEMNRNLDASTSESTIKSTKPPSKTRATPVRATSRARSKTPVASSSAVTVSTVSAIPEVVVEEEETGSKPTTTTNRARARSKTPAVVTANTTDDEFNDTSVPKRLGRKATTQSDTIEAEAAAPAVPKTRRGRSRTAGGTTSGTEDEKKEEYEGAEEREPVVKPKRGRPRKGTTSAVITPAVPNAIKEEESDSSSSTMKPASRAKTLSGIPKTMRTTRATRATSSSAASGTAGTAEEDLDVNKENDEAVVTKTRIGRPRKATGSAVKEEVVTEPELGMSTRRTRGVRTRTKT